MHRRRFLALSSASVLGGVAMAHRLVAQGGEALYRGTRTVVMAGAPKPLRDITLAVDTILPADPLVADDFAASDWGADTYIAAKLGYLGQSLCVWYLNSYAFKTSRRLFSALDEEQRRQAIRAWILERKTLSRISSDLLSGLLSLTVVGTFEGKPREVRDQLYAKMGWFDPSRPTATYHIPCDGYSNLPS